eukprot:Skav200100  [mRNA]  locus=scaffold694:516757:528054:- [translate_table: standard]
MQNTSDAPHHTPPEHLSSDVHVQKVAVRMRRVQDRGAWQQDLSTIRQYVYGQPWGRDQMLRDDGHRLRGCEEMMPAINDKIQNAEDEVEKAVRGVSIAAAPLQVESGEEYLSEAAHVKKLVGPERIRRDLHAGHFGRAPERKRAAEEAAMRWELLKSEAQQRGVKPEVLCPADLSLVSYVQCVGCAASPGSSKLLDDDLQSETCASTRAPESIALDEVASLATAEMVSEITSMVDDLTWHSTSSTARRRQNTELKKLAVELTEQLDQELGAASPEGF